MIFLKHDFDCNRRNTKHGLFEYQLSIVVGCGFSGVLIDVVGLVVHRGFLECTEPPVKPKQK